MNEAIDTTRKYTYADYVTWPDDERWEIIDGEPYAMTPAPSEEHQDAAGLLYGALMTSLAGKSRRPFVAPFDVILDAEPGDERLDDSYDIVQPDVLVVCNPKQVGRGFCAGPPSFVAEVLSPSSTSRDFLKKRELYGRYGVAEYWILDPAAKKITVFRLGEDKSFGQERDYGKDETIAPLCAPDAPMNVGDLFVFGDWAGEG